MSDDPIVRTHEQDTGEGVPDTAHPFGGDDHPMHSWDTDTHDRVKGWLSDMLDTVHVPRLEAARAARRAVEDRLEAGEHVTQVELDHANAELRAAYAEHDDAEARLRTLHVRTPDSFDQVLVGGENGYIAPVRPDERGGWQHNEARRAEHIAEHNAHAERLAAMLPDHIVVNDTGEHGGSTGEAPQPEVTQP